MSFVASVSPVDTPIGEMVAVSSDTHLLLFEFARRRMFDTQFERVRRAFGCEFRESSSPIIDRLRQQLDEYFLGSRLVFDIPILAPGTEFQMRVWNELRRIPAGTTISYGALARAIGQPDAVRAVARANGDNRFAILIPCHRVIGSDGSLTGYGGGLWRKKKLLELESRAAQEVLAL